MGRFLYMRSRYLYILILGLTFSLMMFSCGQEPKVEIIKQWFDKDSTMLQTEYSVVIIGQDTFRNGRSSEYFQNGNIKQSVNYDHGLIVGQVNAYFKNGLIMTEQSYSKGLLHGLSKDFYENGNVKLEVTYENGIMDGDMIEYYFSGQKSKSITLVSGLKNGPSLIFDSLGSIYTRLNYKNNLLDGEIKSFYPDGKILLRRFYKKVKPKCSILMEV
jgi:antitoxin component YwqK of YwqJK toxin-antitoxin module